MQPAFTIVLYKQLTATDTLLPVHVCIVCVYVSSPQVGLGLIALLVTAIGEYVEGLKQEALIKAQQIMDESMESPRKGTGGAAGETYEIETHNHHAKKKKGLGKMGIATNAAHNTLDKTKSGDKRAETPDAGVQRKGGKMEP